MDIIPPEAAHVMSLASVDPGSGPLMPVNSALPSAAPRLVVSPAITGREDGENSKRNTESAEITPSSSPRLASLASSLLGATALDASNNQEKDGELGQNLKQHSTDNIALPIRRPSVERVKTLPTNVGQTVASTTAASSETNTGSVETLVTTKSSSDKPHHIVLPKDGNKTPSITQSISPEGVNHTKTLIQVHTPSSSSKTTTTGSVTSESESSRVLTNVSNPISGGQKVTLVTRQNDPDHVSIVLNPSMCSTSEIIAATATSSSLISTPGSIEASETDGSKDASQENKSSSTYNDTAVVSSSSTALSTANSSGSRKGKKHARKASKDNTNISTTSADEIIGTGAPSKKSRRSASKSSIEKTFNVSSSANDKDVMKSDSFQTKAVSVSHCQRTQTGCSSSIEKVHSTISDTKQELNFSEGKLSKEMRLPLDNTAEQEKMSTDRSVKDANRRVCSGNIELVPANVIDNAILPEKEEYQIELAKDDKGLGITVAGYICEKGKNKNFVYIIYQNFFGVSTILHFV